MNKEFIPYEQALELKELGFDEPCFGWFDTGYLRIGNVKSKHIQGLGELLAPLYQQAFRWFHGYHKLQHNIIWNKFYTDTPYEWGVRKQWTVEPLIPYGHSGMSKTYEEAELACLKKLIEIVKSNTDTP